MSVEKSVCVREEEVLLVNGTPITLEGEEGKAIKDCLLRGAIPNQVIKKASQQATPYCHFSGPHQPPPDQSWLAFKTYES